MALTIVISNQEVDVTALIVDPTKQRSTIIPVEAEQRAKTARKESEHWNFCSKRTMRKRMQAKDENR